MAPAQPLPLPLPRKGEGRSVARNGALQVQILGFALKLERAELVLQVTGSEAGPPSVPELILPLHQGHSRANPTFATTSW